MSLRAAVEGDFRSRQIMTEIFLDAFTASERASEIPCLTIGICTIAILFDNTRLLVHEQTPEANVLLKKEVRRLRRLYPDVFRCCMHFLASPRTEEQRHEVCTLKYSDVCSCTREQSQFLNDMHDLDAVSVLPPFEPNELLSEMFLDLLGMALVSFYTGFRTLGVLPRLVRKAEHGRTSSMWPTRAQDLYPYGIAATLVNICAWIKHIPIVVLLDLARTMHFLIAYPAYNTVLICITPDTLTPILTHALSFHDRRQEYSTVFTDLQSVKLNIQTILTLSRECFDTLLPLQNSEMWQTLIRIMLRTADVLDEIAQTAPALVDITPSQLHVMRNQFIVGVLRFQSIFNLPVDVPHVRQMLRTSHEPVNALFRGLHRWLVWILVLLPVPTSDQSQREV